jgi:hypothetical protein
VNRLTELLRRAALIYQTEGLLTLAKRVTAFAAGQLFRYESYYLYENNGSAERMRRDADFVPRVEGVTFAVIRTNEEADALEAQGFKFRKYVVDTESKLDKGAIAFCIFVGHELGNIGWLCITEQARGLLNEPPARVGFSKGEVWHGGAWTNPEYRRMGLYRYIWLKEGEYYLQKKIPKGRWAIAKRNVNALAAQSKAGNLRYGEGRLIKVLWWKSWKEKRLT